MPDIRVTDLESVGQLNPDDILYVIQDGLSRQVTAANLFGSITDAEIRGNIYLVGNTQVLLPSNVGTSPVAIDILKTEFRANEAGTYYPTLLSGREGQLKIISLVETVPDGIFTLNSANSDIYGNLELTFVNPGDTAFMYYSEQRWRVLGTSPGFKSNISGTTDDIIEAPGTANLYYTNTRSRAAISAGDATIIYNSVTG